MKIEIGILANCSEATVRLNLEKVPKDKLEQLMEKLELELNERSYEEKQTDWDDQEPEREFDWIGMTYYEIERIFGIDCLKIYGDAPYNNSEEITDVINRYINNPQIEWSEP